MLTSYDSSNSLWSHLPNAAHIDWVISDLGDNHNDWYAAHRGAARDAAYEAAYQAAYYAARGAVYEAARGAVYEAARDAAQDAARNAAWWAASDAARNAAWRVARNADYHACLALIAYDHAGALFDRPLEQVRVMAYLGQPAAILMLPACVLWAKEKHVLMAASERP